MEIKFCTGVDPNTDSRASADRVDKRIVKFVAGGAIPTGSAVTLNSGATGLSAYTQVIAGRTQVYAAGEGKAVVGVYEGSGGTGSATTISGLTGKDCLTNDVIDVTVQGMAAVRVTATTVTACISGTWLVLGVTTAGTMTDFAATTGGWCPVICLGTATTTGLTAMSVLVGRF